MTITFLRPGGAAPIARQYSLLPYGRMSVNVNEIAGLNASDVSAVVTATTGGVVAERTMFWGDLFYGGHTGKAIARYIRERRVDAIAHQLRTEKRWVRVGDLAFRFGFAGRDQLTRAFKQRYGATVNEYLDLAMSGAPLPQASRG